MSIVARESPRERERERESVVASRVGGASTGGTPRRRVRACARARTRAGRSGRTFGVAGGRADTGVAARAVNEREVASARQRDRESRERARGGTVERDGTHAGCMTAFVAERRRCQSFPPPVAYSAVTRHHYTAARGREEGGGHESDRDDDGGDGDGVGSRAAGSGA